MIGVSSGPQALVRGDCDRAAAANLLHVRDWILGYRLLNKIDIVFVKPREISKGLVYVPGSIRVQPYLRGGADRRTESADHFQLSIDVQPNFQVEHLKAFF